MGLFRDSNLISKYSVKICNIFKSEEISYKLALNLVLRNIKSDFTTNIIIGIKDRINKNSEVIEDIELKIKEYYKLPEKERIESQLIMLKYSRDTYELQNKTLTESMSIVYSKI